MRLVHYYPRVGVGDHLSDGEKEDFLRRAFAYLHPSRWESHSLGLVEALAYGIPSVISAVCSIAPQVRAADAAVVVDPTPDDIARGISTIHRNPRAYSDRAIDFVRTNLAWSSIIGGYLGQIESLRNGQAAVGRGPR
jgi:glycosyltransferase involved in cell wall biosynthesis